MAQAFGGLVGGIIQHGAAKDAQKAQVGAANKQLALEREIFDYSKDIQAPFVDAGTMANAILQYELWGGDAPVTSTGGYEVNGETYNSQDEAERALASANARFNKYSKRTERITDPSWGREGHGDFPDRTSQYHLGTRTSFDPQRGIDAAGFDPRGASIKPVDEKVYQGFQETPDYKFAFQQGQNAVTSSAAARGGLKSGATLKALTEYGQNFAGLRRDNYINQLFGMAGRGQASTNALQQAGQAYAGGSSNALSAIGNAQAAGAIARGNIASGMVQNGIQGVASMWGGGMGGIGSIASQMLGGFGGGMGGGFGGVHGGIY